MNSTINPVSLKIKPELLKLLSWEIMRQYGVLPFDRKGDKLCVAMADPSNSITVQKLRTLTGLEIEVFGASREAILQALDGYAVKKPDAPLCKEFVIDYSSSNEEAPIIKIVEKLFELALKQRASDIHLEPQHKGLFVRYRIDGALKTIHEFPLAIAGPLISRIKVTALMDITQKRLPQDGQISMKIAGRDIDLRVSTLPAKYGEKVVIRLLDKSTVALDLGRLGMNPHTQSTFERMIDKPQGIILVTGPTGAGKTTTLYSVLNRLKSPMKNIITLEDPIEYELLADAEAEAGITQVQINAKINLTFVTALRASLRQDPDVIMVGEIRDRETAEVAMKAAMTGHMVLSTLHTNDSVEAVSRMRDIGVEPYLIASSVVGVMAQRLLRMLCEKCKEAYEPPVKALKAIFGQTTEITKLYRARGCDHCEKTGYRGRIGIYELLSLSDELKQMIHSNVNSDEMRKLAKSQGLKTLRESGLEFVTQGLTTAEEVFRHTI